MRSISMMVFLAATSASVILAAVPADAVTIKGKILNMDEARKYLHPDCFLQLVRLGKNGGISMKTDARGRLVYESKLAHVEMPKSGAFSISTSGLEAGEYIVVVQNLDPFPGYATTLFRRKGETQALKIHVPQDTKDSTLELGEVCFPVPNSKC